MHLVNSVVPIVSISIPLACPDDCTDPSQGTCDTSTGVCTCMTGFTGANCIGKTLILEDSQTWL